MNIDVSDEAVQLDIDAMRDALVALSRIPTIERRRMALRWLVERLTSDMTRFVSSRYDRGDDV